MSDYRVAVVAEGPTDLVMIEAALEAILLPRTFVITLLQPEPTRPILGTGWGGVLKWCMSFRSQGAATLDADPTLSQFDLVIIHVDADVADKSYADYGPEVAQLAANEPGLPCAQPCPPPDDTVAALQEVVKGWLGVADPGQKAVLCMPSKSSESWLVAALLPERGDLVAGLECRTDLAERLLQLPKAMRIRKTERQYRDKADAITRHWPSVTDLCTQARLFEQDVRGVFAG
jgi:hypothetical protein